MKSADLIFPLRGKTAARQPVGGKCANIVSAAILPHIPPLPCSPPTPSAAQPPWPTPA